MNIQFALMPFAEFANAMRPSGAVNRVSLPGTETDVFAYSVYMNGPVAMQLPPEAVEYHYKDVMVNAMTEKLGLDSSSFRDNLKVAEIVATRGAWMAAVRESAKDRSVTLAADVLADYTLLADTESAMTHPWIAAELEKQVALSMGLMPVLAAASQAMGGVPVTDRAPREVGAGRVVSQNLDFTVQKTADGEVVTHENRRLNALPAVGDEVTVSYYRGSGQVVESLEKMNVSEPFIEKASQDLAVGVVDGKGKKQVVLFNSMTGFRDFVQAHGLDMALVPMAMEARAASPKSEPAKTIPERSIRGGPYIEQDSGCLAIDFTEGGMEHAALFGSIGAMEGCAAEFGISPSMLAVARKLETQQGVPESEVGASRVAIQNRLGSLVANPQKAGDFSGQQAPRDGQLYVGKIVAESALHVAQDIGRGHVVVHDLRALDKVVREGESMAVKYQNGRGQVAEVVRETKGVGR